jgi:hypothetical protein
MTREMTRTLLSTQCKVNAKMDCLIHKRKCYLMSLSYFEYARITICQSCSEHHCFLHT